MKISEIFYSVNGEGLASGKASVFVRTFGCNLNCKYCDTLYAKGDNPSKEMNVTEVIKEIRTFPCERVCITGGEPLLQKEVLNLIIRLLSDKYEIDIETNGSVLFPWWFNSYHNLHIVMDWKCPCSGMQHQMKEWNWRMLGRKDAVKFVVKSKRDFKYVEKTLEEYWFPELPIFVSPVTYKCTQAIRIGQWLANDNMGEADLKEVAEYVKYSNFPLTMQLQIQKFIYPGVIKGV